MCNNVGMIRTLPSILVLASAALAGCAPAEIGADAAAQTDGGVRVPVEGLETSVLDGVATSERAYLALGGEGIAIVDPRSGALLDRWTVDDAGDRLWIDGLQRTPGELVGWGLIEEETPGEHWEDGWSKHMVVMGFDEETGATRWRQILDLTDVLVPDPSRAILIEMPIVEATVIDDEVTVSLRSTQVDDRLITFPRPEGDASYAWDEVPGATTPPSPRGPRGLFGTDEGVLVACGSAGLWRVTAEAETELAPYVGFAIDARPLGDRLVIADGDGFVHLVDGEGSYVGGIEVEGRIVGLDVDEDDVVVVLDDGLHRLPATSLLASSP